MLLSRMARLKPATTHILPKSDYFKHEIVVCAFCHVWLVGYTTSKIQIVSSTSHIKVTEQLVKKLASSICHGGEVSLRHRAGTLGLGRAASAEGQRKKTM